MIFEFYMKCLKILNWIFKLRKNHITFKYWWLWPKYVLYGYFYYCLLVLEIKTQKLFFLKLDQYISLWVFPSIKVIPIAEISKYLLLITAEVRRAGPQDRFVCIKFIFSEENICFKQLHNRNKENSLPALYFISLGRVGAT